MATGFKIQLEDKGQDFLELITDTHGNILEAKPFQTEVWKGGFIPVESQQIGEPCMMHKPPHFNYGYLNYNVINITPLTNDSN